MKRIIVVICMTAGLFNAVSAQVEVNLKTGLAILRLEDERDLNDDIVHYGHTYGFDAIVLESRFMFAAGMHYHRVALGGTTDGEPFESRDNVHQIHVPVNFGVQLTGEWLLRIRPYIGGHVNMTVAVDDNAFGLNTDRVTGFNPGWQFGVQCAIYPITFDAQVVYGGRKFILARDDSKFRGLVLLAGIAF